MGSPSLDAAFGIDRRAKAALVRLGIFVGELQATEQPLRWQLPFTFSGDRELAKYHVSTFLADEYNVTHVEFFASVKAPTRCYCQFTWRSE